MKYSKSVKTQLIDFLGGETYDEKGELNSLYLADMIFSDDYIRKSVNKIVHEAVKKDISLKSRANTGMFFIESAILGSAQLGGICDFIWLVDAPEHIRIDRIINRNGMTVENIKKRIRTQDNEISLLPTDKINVILNDGNQSIINRIIQLLKNIKENAKRNIIYNR